MTDHAALRKVMANLATLDERQAQLDARLDRLEAKIDLVVAFNAPTPRTAALALESAHKILDVEVLDGSPDRPLRAIAGPSSSKKASRS